MFFDRRCHHRDRGMMSSNIVKIMAVGALVYVGAKALQEMTDD